MHSLFLMPGTHLCLRRWWKADPRCGRLWGKVMQGATEGQVSPPEPVQYGSHYIKETLVLKGPCSPSVTCFGVLSCLFTQKTYLFSSSPVSGSFCPSACDRGDAYDVPSVGLLMSPALHPLLILTRSLSCCLCPRTLSYSRANIFPLQAVWCSCLSVSHPLFWHLHAVKDRQKRHRQWQPVRRNKTCFDGVSCRPQNVRRTLYIKAIRILEAAVVRLETVELLQMVQVRCLET